MHRFGCKTFEFSDSSNFQDQIFKWYIFSNYDALNGAKIINSLDIKSEVISKPTSEYRLL